MADEPEEICEECEEGAPEWMVTFADLATLLLCFFVLLLSFSNMDVVKYKELRGSLERSLGVQRVVPAYTTPKGRHIVSRDFDSAFMPQIVVGNHPIGPPAPEIEAEIREGEKTLNKLIEALIKEGRIEVETDEIGQIVMRLLGQTTFDSGRAAIKPEMGPILDKIGEAIGQTQRNILVAGHSDNIPLKGGQYGSNLGLSAARAAAVVEFFLKRQHVRPEKIATMAFGDGRPLHPNDSPENRQRNRRVEIILAAISTPK